MRANPDPVEVAFMSGVQEARVRLGMSQARLAELMTSRGHTWHQTTVAKSESGERRLLLGEAVALGALLHVDLPGYQ